MKKVTFKTLLSAIKEDRKRNITFLIYVLLNVYIAILLRLFTINMVDNLLEIKPILGDLAIVILLGSFSFLFKGKASYIYLIVLSTIFSTICVLNSIYYTAYTSFTSFAIKKDLSDAISMDLLNPKNFIYILSPKLLVISLIDTFSKENNNTNQLVVEKRIIHIIKTIVSLIVGGLILLIFITSLTTYEINRFKKQWNREYIVMKFGIYTYQANDIVKTIIPSKPERLFIE